MTERDAAVPGLDVVRFGPEEVGDEAEVGVLLALWGPAVETDVLNLGSWAGCEV